MNLFDGHVKGRWHPGCVAQMPVGAGACWSPAGLPVSTSAVQAGIAAGAITLRVRDQLLQSLLLLVLLVLVLLELSPSRCSRPRLLQPCLQACVLSLQLLQLQELLGLQPATAPIHLLDALPELLQPCALQLGAGQHGLQCTPLL